MAHCAVSVPVSWWKQFVYLDNSIEVAGVNTGQNVVVDARIEVSVTVPSLNNVRGLDSLVISGLEIFVCG